MQALREEAERAGRLAAAAGARRRRAQAALSAALAERSRAVDAVAVRCRSLVALMDSDPAPDVCGLDHPSQGDARPSVEALEVAWARLEAASDAAGEGGRDEDARLARVRDRVDAVEVVRGVGWEGRERGGERKDGAR